MIKKLLVYNNFCDNCYENLAIEHQLLKTVDDQTAILYLWQNRDTVVIGKNQNPLVECDMEKIKNDNVFIARRLSGGGAVFHDSGNLNFTFILSNENYDVVKQLDVIKVACSFNGIVAEISGRNDILTDGKKFSGNAFYHTKTNAYHHGTLLINSDLNRIDKYLTPDISKLQAKGIKSVKSRVIKLTEINKEITCDKMRNDLIKAFEQVYNLKAEFCPEININEIEETVKEYSSWDYIFGTPIPYSFSFKDKLSLGVVDLRICVKNGEICDAQVFTDSLDYNLPAKLSDSLKNLKYDFDIIKEKLTLDFGEDVAQEIIDLMKKHQ